MKSVLEKNLPAGAVALAIVLAVGSTALAQGPHNFQPGFNLRMKDAVAKIREPKPKQ
jgi:hypothetical protein